MNIQKMMAQAQAMQSKVQAELEEMRVEASAGGEMVKVVLSGTKEIQSVKIDKAAVDPEDVETLETWSWPPCARPRAGWTRPSRRRRRRCSAG